MIMRWRQSQKILFLQKLQKSFAVNYKKLQNKLLFGKKTKKKIFFFSFNT